MYIQILNDSFLRFHILKNFQSLGPNNCTTNNANQIRSRADMLITNHTPEEKLDLPGPPHIYSAKLLTYLYSKWLARQLLHYSRKLGKISRT